MANNKRKKGYRHNKNLTSLHSKQSLLKKDIPLAIVEIKECGFLPNFLQIQKGTIVRWLNKAESSTHCILSPSLLLESPILDEGGYFDSTFNSVGVFDFYSNMNPCMGGKVEVIETINEKNLVDENPEDISECLPSSLGNEDNNTKQEALRASKDSRTKHFEYISPRSLQFKAPSMDKDHINLKIQSHINMWRRSKKDIGHEMSHHENNNQNNENPGDEVIYSDEDLHLNRCRDKLKKDSKNRHRASSCDNQFSEKLMLSSSPQNVLEDNQAHIDCSYYLPVQVKGPSLLEEECLYIDLENYTFVPPQFTITKGKIVVFRFKEADLSRMEEHDIQILRILTPQGVVVKESSASLCPLSCGESSGWRFNYCCTMEYGCSVYPFMNGSITVVDQEIEKLPEDSFKKKKKNKKKNKNSLIGEQQGLEQEVDILLKSSSHVGKNPRNNKKSMLKWIRRKSAPAGLEMELIDNSIQNNQHEEQSVQELDKTQPSSWIQFGDIICPLNNTLDSHGNPEYKVLAASTVPSTTITTKSNTPCTTEISPSCKDLSVDVINLDFSDSENMLLKRWKLLESVDVYTVENCHALPDTGYKFQTLYKNLKEFHRATVKPL